MKEFNLFALKIAKVSALKTISHEERSEKPALYLEPQIAKEFARY